VNLYIARVVYLLLVLSIYAVTLLGMSYLFMQPHRYLIWWSVLLSAPIFMSSMLLFSILVSRLGQIDIDQNSSTVKRLMLWYYDSCRSLELESYIAYMCIWLSHLHFITGSLAVVIALIAYIANANGPYLTIAGLLLIYLFILKVFSALRKHIAPQPRFDS
jgi:hypothetical protein